MAVAWKCDICGVPTHMNPPTRPVLEPAVDAKGAPIVDPKGQPVMVQAKRRVRVQDQFSGKLVPIEVGKVEDLAERAIVVRLKVGEEAIQRDFCAKCVQTLMPDLKPLWDRLEGIEGQ